MQVPLVNSNKFVNVLTTPGKLISLKAGAIIRAEVVSVNEPGEVMLRVILPVDEGKYGQGSLIKAYTEVPMDKGQSVYLEVMGADKDIRLRYIGLARSTAASLSESIPAGLFKMLAEISGSKLSSAEFNSLLNILKSLPQDVKMVLSELEGLEKFFSHVNQLNGSLLRAIVEGSGVVFEARLKLAIFKEIINGRGAASKDFLALQSEDMKGLLLKLAEMLKHQGVADALRQAGLKEQEMTETVDKFLKNIEFFQLTSKINDMLYTFLPVLWEDLKDGELIFKKDSNEDRESYTCNINLELEPLGKLSVSITMFEKAFYVTFFTETAETRDIIVSEKEALEQRFASQGLVLRIMNFNQKHIEFGHTQRREVDLKA